MAVSELCHLTKLAFKARPVLCHWQSLHQDESQLPCIILHTAQTWQAKWCIVMLQRRFWGWQMVNYPLWSLTALPGYVDVKHIKCWVQLQCLIKNISSMTVMIINSQVEHQVAVTACRAHAMVTCSKLVWASWRIFIANLARRSMLTWSINPSEILGRVDCCQNIRHKSYDL